jgi:ribosome-binding protein aMBF1 (putative translation factor)
MKKISPMREKRFYAQVSLDWLSRKTRIEKSRLSRIENGWIIPTERERRKIAYALKAQETEIFGNWR